MYHSKLTLIISCTRSWNFAWHIWRSTTESNKYCQTLGNNQTIHTLCCKDDYFRKGKFKLFNSLFHQVYLVQKVCFLLQICLPCVICGTYETKIKAVLWHSVRQIFASLGLFTFERIACKLNCNFESKQANSITLFVRRPNNNIFPLLSVLGIIK